MRGCIITHQHHPSLQADSLAAGAGLWHQGIRQRWWTPHTGQEEALCWQQDLLRVLRGPREQSLGAKPHW